MACPTVALTAAEIQRELSGLPDWVLREGAIERVYRGKTYLEALDRLNAIARASETADHHPDLSLNWKTLTVRYWTHTAKGVTALDFELARQVEAILTS